MNVDGNLIIAVALSTVLPAALMQTFPLWQKSFFFTVRVAPDFARSDAARRILRRFRIAVWTTAAVCAAAMAAAGASGGARFAWVLGFAPLVNAVVMTGLMQWARISTLPYGAPPGGLVRRASLISEEDDQPWWIWAAPIAAIAILASAAGYLASHWAAIPERFPVHWGIDGAPNRWTRKSVMGVFGNFLIGAAVMGLLTFTQYALAQSGSAGGNSSSTASPRRRLNQALVALLMLPVAGLFAASLVTPLRGTDAALIDGPGWVRVAPILLLTLPPLWMMFRLQRAETGEAEVTRDACWYWGIFYADREDSRLMVPNRTGPGYTFNFGHSRTLVFGLAALVGLPMLISSVIASTR